MNDKKNWKMEYYVYNLTQQEGDTLLDMLILYVESCGGVMTGILGENSEDTDDYGDNQNEQEENDFGSVQN